MSRMIIAGGTVVLPNGAQQTDILIESDKIVSIGHRKHFPRSDNLIDAKDKVVLPGLIDIHVHFLDRFMGTVSLHDFFTGTRAAAYGGVTTIIDFANQKKGGSLAEAIQSKRAEADDNVVIDYSVHAEITDPTLDTIKEVKKIIKAGVPSFKVYTIYDGMKVDDGAMVSLLEQTAKHGGLVIIHAENDNMAQRRKSEFLSQGKTAAIYHALSKPNLTEAEAINRVAYLAEYLGAPFYIVHMSTLEGCQIIRRCQKNGLPAFAETCTHYLCLTDDVYKKRNGINYIISPPLRKNKDLEALWANLLNGTIAVVSTDDASFSVKSKKMGKDRFDKVPNGMAGVELRLPVLYSEGVINRGLSLERLAAISSTNPARLFGLYPQKGVIWVGSDADIVILDPDKEVTLGMKTTHMVTDFCSLEGLKVRGYPTTTIARGKVIVDGGEFLGQQGAGRFLKREIDFNSLQYLR